MLSWKRKRQHEGWNQSRLSKLSLATFFPANSVREALEQVWGARTKAELLMWTQTEYGSIRAAAEPLRRRRILQERVVWSSTAGRFVAFMRFTKTSKDNFKFFWRRPSPLETLTALTHWRLIWEQQTSQINAQTHYIGHLKGAGGANGVNFFIFTLV